MDYQQILKEQMKETLDADAFDALTKQVAEYSGGMAGFHSGQHCGVRFER